MFSFFFFFVLLSFLGSLTDLEYLHLKLKWNQTAPRTLDCLSKLVKLRALDLNTPFFSPTGTAFLTSLTTLRRMSLVVPPTAQLCHVTGLNQLRELLIVNLICSPTACSDLGSLTSLVRLSLDRCSIECIDFLSRLTCLEKLVLGLLKPADVPNLNPLSVLTRLQLLVITAPLSLPQVDALEPLASLCRLQCLAMMCGNGLNRLAFRALTRLTSLRSLELSNQLTNASRAGFGNLEEIRAALPDLVISVKWVRKPTRAIYWKSDL